MTPSQRVMQTSSTSLFKACHFTSKFSLLRMSDMRMEELNRRHSVILGSQSPLKSPQGSLMSHNNRSSDKSDEYSRSPAPDTTAGNSRQNSLVVAVQQRRASIISIGQQGGGHHSQDNLLEVTAGGQLRPLVYTV